MSLAHFSIKARLALGFTIVLWASAFVGIRAGLQGYSPGGLAVLRFLVASTCMLAVIPFLPTRARIPWRDRICLMLVGTLGLGFYNIALNHGEMAVTSGVASFIISLAPVVTVILSVLCFGEATNRKMIMGMLVSLLGVALISCGETNHFHFNIGILYVLAAAIAGGIYNVLQKALIKKYHAIEVIAWVIWGATLFLLIWLPTMLLEIKQAPMTATIAAIYLGIFPAAVGYIAWCYGLREVPACIAANTMYFLPVLATSLGWLILNEIPTTLSLVGGLIALTGVWIVNHRGKFIAESN